MLGGLFKYAFLPFCSMGFSNAFYTNKYFSTMEKLSLKYQFSEKDFGECLKRLEQENVGKSPDDAIKFNIVYKSLIKIGPYIRLDT